MNLFTENILANIEEVLSQLVKLSDELESNSWEFEPNSTEENYWLQMSDRVRAVATNIKNKLPF